MDSMRLHKILSHAGISSRRKAEELIKEGHVTVNGKIVTELGIKADISCDHIKIDGKLITRLEPKVYILLNKPRGYITTLKDKERRPTVIDLLKKVKLRVYPVGRLDYDAEGILLFTNDGDMAHNLAHPRYMVPKTYLAKVSGIPNEAKIKRLNKGGLRIEGQQLPPSKTHIERISGENSWLRITIYEGQNRQIKRMCMAIGHSVQRLKRVRYASLSLSGLSLGAYRYLDSKEVEMLKRYMKRKKKK